MKLKTKLIQIEDYLLLINEEAEIKEGDIVYRDTGVVFKITNERISYYREVIPKTVHKIYKCLAYYPLTKEAKELDLPLLPNPFEEVDIERLADKWFLINNYNKEDLIHSHTIPNCITNKNLFIEGYKAAQSKQFSLDDMRKAIEMAREQDCSNFEYYGFCEKSYTDEEIIQSISTQQLPSEFIPEYENVDIGELVDMNGNYNGENVKQLKTITNSEGREELVGTYK